MKCLSLNVKRDFIPGVYMSPGFFVVNDHYPTTAEVGISVPIVDRTIRMDRNLIVRVNDALLNPALNAVRYERDCLVVLRASVRLGEDGFFEFIPERADDKDGAIVFFDVGSGEHSIVRYSTKPFEAIATGVSDLSLFFGYEETLLVAMAPGSCVYIHRLEKQWIFFGKEQLQEVLTYRWDGQQLVLANVSAQRE